MKCCCLGNTFRCINIRCLIPTPRWHGSLKGERRKRWYKEHKDLNLSRSKGEKRTFQEVEASELEACESFTDIDYIHSKKSTIEQKVGSAVFADITHNKYKHVKTIEIL